MLSSIKQFVKDNQNNIVLIIGVILIALISFGAGRLASKPVNCEPEQIINTNQNGATQNSPGELLIDKKLPEEKSPQISPVQIIGNKNSKIYHYPWCSGAKNMKEENKVFFNSIDEAKNAGYKPAGNCPGL